MAPSCSANDLNVPILGATSRTNGKLSRDQHWCQCAYRSATTFAYCQLLFAIEPEKPLVVHNVALAPEQHVNASISEAATFMRQCLHSLAKVMIVAAARFITDRHPANADGFKRPPFTHLMVAHQMRDSVPLGCGRHH